MMNRIVSVATSLIATVLSRGLCESCWEWKGRHVVVAAGKPFWVCDLCRQLAEVG